MSMCVEAEVHSGKESPAPNSALKCHFILTDQINIEYEFNGLNLLTVLSQLIRRQKWNLHLFWSFRFLHIPFLLRYKFIFVLILNVKYIYLL